MDLNMFLQTGSGFNHSENTDPDPEPYGKEANILSVQEDLAHII